MQIYNNHLTFTKKINVLVIYLFSGMKNIKKIGILHETKSFPEKRVAITPTIAKKIMQEFTDFDIELQSSNIRCFSDQEYSDLGISIRKDLSETDLLIGISELDINKILEGATYLLFPHVRKQQPRNQEMFKAMISKKITLIDFELLKGQDGIRLMGFGKWAGIVGSYNALLAWGKRSKTYELLPAYQSKDLNALLLQTQSINLEKLKILITGGGRAAGGALELFEKMKIRQVNPGEFLQKSFNEPVVCQIDPWNYYRRKAGKPFDMSILEKHPEEFESIFHEYTEVADILIACQYWTTNEPYLISYEDLKHKDFHIRVIADVSADIPGAIWSTQKYAPLEMPFYGYNPKSELLTDAFSDNDVITIMASDCLPNALPRDASEDFARNVLKHIIPNINVDGNVLLNRATILENGILKKDFQYLDKYAFE